jgi:thiol-disulfide isomerase/thioredoxin
MRLETGTLFEKDKKFLSSVDLNNRPYLLNFWATWCGPCRAEFDELEELWQESSTLNGLAVIGVNVAEDEKKAKNFVELKSSTFEILLDLDSELSNEYKVTGIPATFLIYNGEVYDRWSGPISPNRVKASLKRLQEDGILDK